jgi:hypothetical protein
MEHETWIESFTTFIKILLIVSFPFVFIYMGIWQSLNHADLNRKVKELSKQREDLIKKNFDLKAKIATNTSISRMSLIYEKTNQNSATYLGNKIITITLPKETKNSKRD